MKQKNIKNKHTGLMLLGGFHDMEFVNCITGTVQAKKNIL